MVAEPPTALVIRALVHGEETGTFVQGASSGSNSRHITTGTTTNTPIPAAPPEISAMGRIWPSRNSHVADGLGDGLSLTSPAS